jgi:hypothetical protein
VIVIGIFEWKQICVGFFLSFVWWSSYQEGRVGIPLTSLTLPHFCACPKTGSGIPTSYISALLPNVLNVDIFYGNFKFLK